MRKTTRREHETKPKPISRLESTASIIPLNLRYTKILGHACLAQGFMVVAAVAWSVLAIHPTCELLVPCRTSATVLVVSNVRLLVRTKCKLECSSQTTAVHVTIVICAHAVARTLLLRPLWNRSALLVSPPGVPGVLALDVKPTARRSS